MYKLICLVVILVRFFIKGWIVLYNVGLIRVLNVEIVLRLLLSFKVLIWIILKGNLEILFLLIFLRIEGFWLNFRLYIM